MINYLADKEDGLGVLLNLKEERADHMSILETSLFREIVVDNFAGGGGASTGIEKATGLNVTKYYGSDTGQSLYAPLHTVTTKDRFGLVIVKGTPYKIYDVGLRMLQPRELFNGQGFPKDYIIDVDYEGKKNSKKEQVARCGNAVPPAFSFALTQANLPDLCAYAQPIVS